MNKELVSIEEWLNSNYYSRTCKLYGYWKNVICDIFKDNKQKYNHIVLAGGIGTGKTSVSIHIVLRKIYELSKDDSNDTRSIAFNCDVTTLKTLTRLIETTSYFKENISEIEYKDDALKLNNDIHVVLCSNCTDTHNCCLMVTDTSSMSKQYIQQLYEKSLSDPTIKYVNARLWDVAPQNYSNQHFYVFAGNDDFYPFIIDDISYLGKRLNIDLESDLLLGEAVSKLKQDYDLRIDEVSIDFKRIYENNLIRRLQDFSCMVA